MDRPGAVGKGRRWVSWSAAGMLALAGCGAPQPAKPASYHALSALHVAPLAPGAEVALKVVGDGTVPVLTLSYGQLPDGLALGTDGYIRGTPKTPGQYQHFTLSASTPDGIPLDSRSYTLAVGVTGSSLQQPLSPTRQNDILSFDGITWNSTLSFAYAWDAQLNLLWPLRAGGQLSGQSMAPAGSSLSLIVAGNNASGQFDLALPSMDARIGSVAALTWEGDADFDLVLVPDPQLNANPVTADAPTLDVNGQWMARHEIASTAAPGPEVVSLATNAPTARYALVALKRSGAEVHTHLWLSARRRDGTEIVEQDFDSLFSDTAQGSLADEMKAGRQSFRPLGLITVAVDGSTTYSSPADSPDLFEVPAEAQ